MKNKAITLEEIAGYATEKQVWQMMLNLSESCGTGVLGNVTHRDIVISGSEYLMQKIQNPAAGKKKAFAAPETFKTVGMSGSETSDIWTLGAVAFYMITGENVFEGKGGETQNANTQIPRISSTHASGELSSLIHRCLSFSPKERPSVAEIRQMAHDALGRPEAPRRKLTSLTGKGYSASLITFWPEEMVMFLLFCLLSCIPISLSGQTGRFEVPDEMANLVFQCADLRSASNTDKVTKALQQDLQWTIMDELPPHDNECTETDEVGMFGLNDIMPRLLLKRRGVVNTSSKMRDGRDKRFHYSLLEITVKKNSSVSYQIEGRKGEQIFAIVPFDTNTNYKAFIEEGDRQEEGFNAEKTRYIRLRKKIKETDRIKLTVSNQSDKNAAFIIINYNSQNND